MCMQTAKSPGNRQKHFNATDCPHQHGGIVLLLQVPAKHCEPDSKISDKNAVYRNDSSDKTHTEMVQHCLATWKED